MKLLLNYTGGRIAIFDTKLFDHRENKEDKKSLSFEIDLQYPSEHHEQADDYPFAL